MEKGHTSISRGTSWSPGSSRKPLQLKQDIHTHEGDYSTPWEKMGFNKEHSSRKTNLSRSTSLSENELEEARVRSHIIAAQLTIPSNSGSRSRGVQLFNRRKQRVNAFTVESGERDPQAQKVKNAKGNFSPNKLILAEKTTEDKDHSYKNFQALSSPPISEHSVGDSMDEQVKGVVEADETDSSVIQERHFLPVREEQEGEEEGKDEIIEELADDVKEEISHGSNNTVLEVGTEAQTTVSCTGLPPAGKLLNGCDNTSGPESMSLALSKQTTTFINRTARPFFSPSTMKSPEAESPVMDIPPPPSYSTPPLPVPIVPQTEYSPLPPPPSYPTPPLPTFTKQPVQQFYSSPPPMSPSKLCFSPSPSDSAISPYQHLSQCGPPTAPKPSTFVAGGERRSSTPLKTGILDEGAVRRGTKKSMFTFKEKPVVTPNPELLSLVQGVDDRKKHGNRSVPEPTSEEELLALGAEASNFLTKEEKKVEGAQAPEWASCLRSSRTQPRVEHRVEQNLTNVSGKGAELFAKRQSRMEKYVVERQNQGTMRSPSPAMSLPPSWVYSSNMPGRVKAIAKNSDISVQLSQNLKAQQAVRQKTKAAVPEPAPIPEAPPLENGCSKIEMDLSRHRPYQLNSSLFVFNPIKDPISTLPRRAPQASSLPGSHAFFRQTSLPSHSSSHIHVPEKTPPLSVNSREILESPLSPDFGHPRVTSPVSPTPAEKTASSRAAVQAPKPTFSAKKAGITPQVSTKSTPGESLNDSPTVPRSSILPSRFSSPATGFWSSGQQASKLSTMTQPSSSPASPVISSKTPKGQTAINHPNVHVFIPPFKPKSESPVPPCSPPWGSRSHSPMGGQSATLAVKSQSPVTTPWSARCQSSAVGQNNKPSAILSCPTSRPSTTWMSTHSHSLPRRSKSLTPQENQDIQTFAISTNASRHFQTSASPAWASRSQSPAPYHSSPTGPFAKLNSPATQTTSPSPQHVGSRCMSPIANNLDSRANHRLLAKNIINAAKRKNSPSPGALSGHSLPITPLGHSYNDCHKPPMSPYHSRALGAQSPVFASPPPTPTQTICSPVRLYNTRSLTDSDASIESEDSGLRSPGLLSNTCPRGWGGSLRVKRSTISTDL